MSDDEQTGCPRCTEVLKMLIEHKHALERARQDLDEATERVDHQALYVHTMALILKGERPL